jgi:Flp pilus assembly protein TadD
VAKKQATQLLLCLRLPVPAVPVAAPPAKTADPASAASRIAQERRARIERVEAQVARARQSGSYADLQSSCLRWTDDQPGSAEAWRCLGLARFQAGDAGGALPALRQSLKLEPNDPQVESTILRILRP